MKNLVLLFILVLISSNHLFSQKLDGKKITLLANTSGYGEKFILETSCYENEIKIKVKVRDSVSWYKLKSDSTYKVLSDAANKLTVFDLKNDTTINLFKKIDSAARANIVYSTDSVVIPYNQFPAYEKLLSKLFNSSVTELEDTENNKRRLVVDGTRMEFRFSQNESIQFTARAHSPRKLSHPLLYEYIIDTLTMIRKLKKTSFITAERTSGY